MVATFINELGKLQKIESELHGDVQSGASKEASNTKNYDRDNVAQSIVN